MRDFLELIAIIVTLVIVVLMTIWIVNSDLPTWAKVIILR